MAYDCIIAGGGIIGLATAATLSRLQPAAKILLVEKEKNHSAHQTGRNSGVIHSGIYYKPGSYKARFAKAGAASMVNFCREHGIRHEVCGKIIVATRESELPELERLFERGQQNGLLVTKLSAREINEIEPHVRCLAGIRVPTTGITSYREVSQKYLELFRERGGEVRFDTALRHIIPVEGGHVVETTSGDYETRFLINCTGLHSDRVARSVGADLKAKIVPFRGEYYELVPDKRHLVKGLIYPVPNPNFPFLGVHFTRMIDGSVHAGPNAVLALKREGYRKTDFDLRDFLETISFSGFRRLVWQNLSEGLKEMHRSLLKSAFVRSLQQLIPEVQSDDLVPCAAGVRAQALTPEGKLVDDFLLVRQANALHVCNAPSPAATASLEIAAEICRQIPLADSKSTVTVRARAES